MFNYNDIRNNRVFLGDSESDMSDMSGFPPGFNGVVTHAQLREYNATGNTQQFNPQVPSESDSFFSDFGSATPSAAPWQHSVPFGTHMHQAPHMP